MTLLLPCCGKLVTIDWDDTEDRRSSRVMRDTCPHCGVDIWVTVAVATMRKRKGRR